MDIGLHPDATGMQNLNEEEYYCFMWCYILDRNYAWKIGRPGILTLGPDTRVDPPTSRPIISTLLLIYLELAKIQDTMIPFLIDSSTGDWNVCRAFNSVASQLLRDMYAIRGKIDQVRDLELLSDIDMT